jgi:hypothetical protein
MMDEPKPPRPQDDKPTVHQHTHTPVAARVPEKVSRGVYCSGQVVMESPKELVIDFLQGLTRPFQVVSRVVVTPQTMVEFIQAYEKNLEGYIQQFGQPPTLPPPPTDHRPTLEEIYENYKLSEDMLSGAYAHTIMIGHSPTEFVFDFITNFYPTSAVAARVYLPSAQAPRFLNTLKTSLQRYQARFAPPDKDRPEAK